MAHTTGGVITAEEAREISNRIVEEGRTPAELKERYTNALRAIEGAANKGSYGVALRVGDDDLPEFTNFITPQGFTIIQNTTVPDTGTVVNEDPQPDTDSLTNLELIWSEFSFEQTTIEIQRPTGVFLTVRVSSYPLARPLYYTLTGTLVASDFSNNLDQGELVFDTEGEASVFLNVKAGGARVGKTVQPLIYYESTRETLLHSFNELTVTV